MGKRRTQAELDGLLKFVLGLTLGCLLYTSDAADE